MTTPTIKRERAVRFRPPEREREAIPLHAELLWALRRVSLVGVLAIPGILTVYLAFNAGGYFPDTTGFVAAVMLVLLALRVVFAKKPFQGVGLLPAIAMAGLAALACWTLASASWSDAGGRALIEFDRVLFYLAVLGFFASFPRDPGHLRWMLRGLLAGIVVVCGIAFVTRALPEVWPIAQMIPMERLSYPFTYWNALGLLAAIGSVVGLHLATDPREPGLGRVLGAAAVPLLAATLLLTFSRGADLVVAAGVVAYLLVAWPRLALTGLIAIAPPAALAIVFAYEAEALASTTPTGPEAVAQGEELALIVCACIAAAGGIRALLLVADERLGRFRLSARGRRVVAGLAVAGAACLAVAALASPYAGRVVDDVDRLFEGEAVGTAPVRGDPTRERLLSLNLSPRMEHWDVAMSRFREEPLKGTGAGTFGNVWAQDRQSPGVVQDAHSLYVETLSELGVVGAVCLAVALLAMLVGLGVRVVRGRNRQLYAVVLIALGMWAVHAGFDWDWETPGLGAGIFALAGITLARRAGEQRNWMPPLARAALAVGLVTLAAVPMLVAVSQAQIDRAIVALDDGDCPAAMREARAAIGTADVRPDPHEVLGYCLIAERRSEAAVREMRLAIARDPDNWEYHEGLAVALAADGRDPSAAMNTAFRLNPLEPGLARDSRGFGTRDPDKRARRARAIAAEIRAFLDDRAVNPAGTQPAAPASPG